MSYPFKSSGIVVYDPPRPGMKRRTHNWCVINCDKEITRYYRWWMDKYINPLGLNGKGLCQPSWDAHISCCRGEAIHDEKLKFWKKYQSMKVDFNYSHEVKRSKNFWFVEVECALIDLIRHELGLRTFYKYHLTIGKLYQNDAEA